MSEVERIVVTALQQIIIERIQREGPITFADYMRMALYQPGYGYYVSGPARMGWEGDYYTSTDVSTFFAHCMGRQIYQMWELLKRPAPFVVLEQGAGRAELARTVREWAEQEAPDLHAVLDYRAADIRSGQDALSPSRHPPTEVSYSLEREISVKDSCLEGGAGDEWRKCQGKLKAPTSPGPPPLAPTGETPLLTKGGDRARKRSGREGVHVLVSNELVDAFPVHIVQVHRGELYEVCVDLCDERFCEVLSEPSSQEVGEYLDSFGIPWRSYGDGWRAEINLEARRWMREAAALLPAGGGVRKTRGFLLAIDYGEKARELYTQYRRRGTLAAYYRHQLSERPLARPGEQDLTAHVNFSALIDEGRRMGLRLHAYTSQRAWLKEMGIYEELERIRQRDFATIDRDRASDQGQVALLQWYNLRQRITTLTEPTGMGNFKVLVMKR